MKWSGRGCDRDVEPQGRPEHREETWSGGVRQSSCVESVHILMGVQSGRDGTFKEGGVGRLAFQARGVTGRQLS